MLTSAKALLIHLLKIFEGCRLIAYLCPANIPTICYGSTAGVRLGMTKTQSECDVLLDKEASAFMLRVLAMCPELAPYPARLAAVTSFAYNLGLGALAASTLKRKIRRKDWAGASAEFPKWRFAGGRELRGLVLRRALERKTFEGG